MKAWQLREMTIDELHLHIKEVQEEIFNLRMQKAIKTIPNPKRITDLRHEYSRCLTILHEVDKGIRPLSGKKE